MTALNSPANRFWRWLLLVATSACLWVQYRYNAHPPAGALSNGQVSARHPTLLTPAGYAFSIWGVIFAGLLLYTGWQLLPRQRNSALVATLTLPLTLAVLATTAWTLVFGYELIGTSLLVMLVLLGLLVACYARARPLVLAGAAPGWPVWFLSLYLGWILLATVLNVIFGLRDGLGWDLQRGKAVVGLNELLVVLAAAITLLLAWRARDPLLPLPVAWGLYATWVARQTDSGRGGDIVGELALLAAAVLALAAPLLWRRQRAG